MSRFSSVPVQAWCMKPPSAVSNPRAFTCEWTVQSFLNFTGEIWAICFIPVDGERNLINSKQSPGFKSSFYVRVGSQNEFSISFYGLARAWSLKHLLCLYRTICQCCILFDTSCGTTRFSLASFYASVRNFNYKEIDRTKEFAHCPRALIIYEFRGNIWILHHAAS